MSPSIFSRHRDLFPSVIGEADAEEAWLLRSLADRSAESEADAEELEQNELLVDAVLKAQEWRYLKKDTSPASTTAEGRCFLGAGGTALCLNTPG